MNSDSGDTDQYPCVVFASSSSSSSHRTRIRNPRKKRTISIIMEDDDNNNKVEVSKPKYGKKPDPGAPKITRPCTECGKKFWSWKALFGHMRCHPERQWRGINPPPNFTRQQHQQQQQQQQYIQMTPDDHEVAASLLLLANANANANAKGKKVRDEIDHMARESPGVSVCGQQEFGFSCSSCKKVFGSHQALGGHRASHKNVKGCFARNDDMDHHDNNMMMMVIHDHDSDNNDQHQYDVGHKCSICLRVFSTGQALGGHKRCHWDKTDAPPPPNAIDLNLPPPHSPPLTLDLRLGL